MQAYRAPTHTAIGRLYNIISEIKQRYDGFMQKGDLFGHVLNVDPKDKLQNTLAYSDLLKLVNEAQQEVLTAGVHEKHKLTVSRVLEAVSKIDISGRNVNLMHFNSSLDAETLIRFEYCAEAVSEKFGQHIPEEKVTNLLLEIEALIAEIRELDINIDLKIIILDSLEGIRAALTNYKFWGPQGIKASLEKGLGSIALNSVNVQNDEEHSLVKRIFSWISNANQVADLGKNVGELAEGISKLLLD